ncbi:MAG: type IV pili methyl-accepting chemotaxis transducer N-terminal domain-containing protein [Natronospirillum sp.]
MTAPSNGMCYSAVSRITLCVIAIAITAVIALLLSWKIASSNQHDAEAINVAGSLRMQTYRLGMLVQSGEAVQRQLLIDKLNQGWQHSAMLSRVSQSPQGVNPLYDTAHQYWTATSLPELMQEIAEPDTLHEQVALIDQWVMQLQEESEQKLQTLQRWLVSSAIFLVAITLLVIYWLKNHIATPVKLLTDAASRLAKGDFHYQLSHIPQNELGLLARTLTWAGGNLANAQQHLEQQIALKTQELQRSNTSLTLLYRMTREAIEQGPEDIDLEGFIGELRQILGVKTVDLCLATPEGERPWNQIRCSSDPMDTQCAQLNCHTCIHGQNDKLNNTDTRFLLQRANHLHGVLLVRTNAAHPLTEWQNQLTQSIADQLAVILSLRHEHDRIRRLALFHERSVIARELHDSLAQSLSYLKIQVVRLELALGEQQSPAVAGVLGELREGLSSAYGHLRDLLTTFRLKINSEGLYSTLQEIRDQLARQSSMHIVLNYRLIDLPLSPQEEIHLVQIIREGIQNAIKHSGGETVTVTLSSRNGEINLSIEDDGVGLTEIGDRPNHYGLVIIRERAESLGGQLSLTTRVEGGARILLSFQPDCIHEEQVIVERTVKDSEHMHSDVNRTTS